MLPFCVSETKEEAESWWKGHHFWHEGEGRLMAAKLTWLCWHLGTGSFLLQHKPRWLQTCLPPTSMNWRAKSFPWSALELFLCIPACIKVWRTAWSRWLGWNQAHKLWTHCSSSYCRNRGLLQKQRLFRQCWSVDIVIQCSSEDFS